jgi:hypothetical protein
MIFPLDSSYGNTVEENGDWMPNIFVNAFRSASFVSYANASPFVVLMT